MGEMDANIKNNAAAYGVSVNEFCEQGFGVKYNKLKKIYSRMLLLKNTVKK